jgi:hypothetical protein
MIQEIHYIFGSSIHECVFPKRPVTCSGNDGVKNTVIFALLYVQWLSRVFVHITQCIILGFVRLLCILLLIIPALAYAFLIVGSVLHTVQVVRYCKHRVK